MLIKVLKTHPHKGRTRKVGEIYKSPAKKARLLIAIGKAEEADEPVAPPAPAPAPEPVAPPAPAPQVPEPTKISISQAALEFAEENNIDLSNIEGTGAGGMITKKDLIV